MLDLGSPSKSSGRQNRPTPASVRRCQIRECRIWPEAERKWSRWIMICIHGGPTFRQTYVSGGPPFASTQKHQKCKLAKIHQNLKKKKTPWTPNASILMIWGRNLDLHLRSSFPDHLDLLNCDKYNAQTSFLLFQASHFGIKIQSSNHVFQNPFLQI